MALYEILEDGTPRKVAGNLKPLVANPVTLNTTRTGQNDTVVEYYVGSDTRIWYRKWASGWKECGYIIRDTTSGITTLTLPITFTNRPTVMVQDVGGAGTSDTVTITMYKRLRGRVEGFANENIGYRDLMLSTSSSNVTAGYYIYACGF